MVEAGGSKSKGTQDLWRLLDRTDPARKKVAFKGFADTVTEKQRLTELEALCKERFKVTPHFEAVYRGPKGQRKLAPVVLADFGVEKLAQDFVKSNKDSALTVAGCTVRVAYAKTELQTQRNVKLRKAKDLVEASPKAADKKVEVEWGKGRQVKLAGEVVYQQDKEGLGGHFSGDFSGVPSP